MPPEAKTILYYYAGLTLLALFVIMRRRPRRGMRLKLGGGRSSSGKTAQPPARPREREEVVTGPINLSRSLNVVFNYNGHSWDAYEVLGVPAGSSLESVEKALKSSLGERDPLAQAFLKAAYQAIVESHSSALKKVR